MANILEDSRFTKYLNDPRYKQIPKHKRKVQIDKRFRYMFDDEKFKVKYTVDKRGRPVNETSTENLRKYYDLVESDDNITSEEEIEGHITEPIIKGNKLNSLSSVESPKESTQGRFVKRPQSDTDEEPHELPKLLNDKLVRGKLDTKTKEKLLDLEVDYARGDGILLSESSSDEESSDNEEDSELEHEWGQLDADADTTDESTKRIAVCNLDWDNIKASDIMVLLNSFVPAGGVILSVTIYPSEFGLKRMQEEEVRGPIELTEEKVEKNESDDSGNEEGSAYHMEKLRRYQLNRLKYFYAVVECDSVQTADKLYSECDGMEYESSATRLDMRFIPDDVTFEQEPHEVCTKLPDLKKYKPRLFTTTALQQAKVQLTWDATNPNRTETIRSALDGKIDDLDLKDYLATSSEEEDEDQKEETNDPQLDSLDDDPIQKYKKLLEDIENKEDKKKNKDMEMEITWGIGIKDTAEELIKKKMNEDNTELTPFEKLMKKKKEKNKEKKLKKQKQKLQESGSSDSDKDSSDDVPSDVDLDDPYFAEEFNKPEFKKGKSSKHKQKEKNNEMEDEEEEKRKAELELLLDDEDDGKAHFSLKKIQDSESNSKKSRRKKKLKEKMMQQKQAMPDFEIDLNDKRFSALYDSHLYNIDPADPNFKKTKNMEKLIQEKLKRRPADTPGEEETQPKKSKEDAELSLLVKSVKRKTKVLNK